MNAMQETAQRPVHQLNTSPPKHTLGRSMILNIQQNMIYVENTNKSNMSPKLEVERAWWYVCVKETKNQVIGRETLLQMWHNTFQGRSTKMGEM